MQDGRKLIPSVTRVFNSARELYVYLQAYQQDALEVGPLVAFVSLYTGQKKAFESMPVEMKGDANGRLKTTPLEFSIALSKLPPGRYDCQVTVLNPAGQKAAFWRAPIMIVQ